MYFQFLLLFLFKGNTALHDCTESGNLKCLQLLLNHRAIMRKDEYGQLPIMSGANAAYKKVSLLLVKKRFSMKYECYIRSYLTKIK